LITRSAAEPGPGIYALQIMKTRSAWLLPAVVVLAACGSSSHAASPVAPSPTTSRTASSSTTARTVPPSTVAPLPGYTSLVAEAVGSEVAVYDRPSVSAPKRTFPNPWSVDPQRPTAVVEQVFLVEDRRTDGWVRVLLPVRPNGSSGWVRASNVAIHAVTYSVKVEKRAHQITVLDRGAVLYRGPVAVGKPTTPTPTGRYYVRVLIQAPNPHTVYGPYAYGLSSHSDALSNFDGGDAEIGLHGNDDALALGHDVTHGCIRMDNAEIATLAALLPLGTPVDIAP
jgi:lipoprotein-anchoring transpeptidase ErfK/SrfK